MKSSLHKACSADVVTTVHILTKSSVSHWDKISDSGDDGLWQPRVTEGRMC